MRIGWIGFLIMTLTTASAHAWQRPEWRPDGVVVVCAKVPSEPTARACASGQSIGWPHTNALLVGTGPREIPSIPKDWEEFKYYYFAPYLSLRCASLRSHKLQNGLTINQHLRAG